MEFNRTCRVDLMPLIPLNVKIKFVFRLFEHKDLALGQIYFDIMLKNYLTL